MDYTKASDFEINKAVAIKQGHKCYYDDGTYTNGRMGSDVVVKGNGILGSINYIYSWERMGPIIADNGICLTSPLSARQKNWAASWNSEGGRWSCGDIVVGNKNPLRAAAIVYLMMGEA